MKIKILEGKKENGLVVGNAYNKYGASNFLVRMIMHNFNRRMLGMINTIQPKSIHEVGCGEGYWTLELSRRGFVVQGTDISQQAIAMAKENAQSAALPSNQFEVASIYDLSETKHAAELVVCCEVLEHLSQPERGVAKLAELANPWCICSVPREPVWSILNMARGKYWSTLGNTPGHIQRWSSAEFIDLLQTKFEIVEVHKPLPWTMCLCRVKFTTTP